MSDLVRGWLPTLIAPGQNSGLYAETAQGMTSDLWLRKWTLSLGASTIKQAGPEGQPEITGPQAAQFGGFADPNSIQRAGGQQLVITTETAGFDFRMTFHVRHADIDHPGSAEIRIYNLKDETANSIIREFNTVVLQAGYVHGHYGVIFQGTIKQYKKGKESATDTYLDIFAADGDAAWNYSFLSKPFNKGTTQDDLAKNYQDAMVQAGGGTAGALTTGLPGGTKPSVRGGVNWGLTSDLTAEHGRTTGTSWSIQNGKVQNIPTTAYAEGEAVVLNAGTGLINVPETTQEGITVTSLLNPNYYIKQQIKIDNKGLNQYFLPGQNPDQAHQFMGSSYSQYKFGAEYYASTQQDGFYCILTIDHEGDTRGLPWYSHLTCLNVDPTNPYKSSVPGGQGFGQPNESG